MINKFNTPLQALARYKLHILNEYTPDKNLMNIASRSSIGKYKSSSSVYIMRPSIRITSTIRLPYNIYSTYYSHLNGIYFYD